MDQQETERIERQRSQEFLLRIAGIARQADALSASSTDPVVKLLAQLLRDLAAVTQAVIERRKFGAAPPNAATQ